MGIIYIAMRMWECTQQQREVSILLLSRFITRINVTNHMILGMPKNAVWTLQLRNEVSKTWNVINLQVIGWREIGVFASKIRDFLQMFVEFNSGTSWTKPRPEPRITVVLPAKSGVTSNICDSRMKQIMPHMMHNLLGDEHPNSPVISMCTKRRVLIHCHVEICWRCWSTFIGKIWGRKENRWKQFQSGGSCWLRGVLPSKFLKIFWLTPRF